MSTGLSDALTRMAGGDHDDTGKPHGNVSSAPPAEDEDVILGELDEPAHGSEQPRIVPAPGRSRPCLPVKRDNNRGLKAAAVPVLITVGALLMVPGIWSLLILAGIWESPREDARTVALAMLATWPIGLSMFAGAGFFWYQIRGK